jgi:DNA methylase
VAKTVILLGLLANSIGGVGQSPVVNAHADLNVSVHAEASATIEAKRGAKARRKANVKTVVPSGTAAKKDGPIQNHTLPGEAVYDCFLGSGTTLIAAEQTGRVCLGVELDPKYVDVIIRRWQQYAGRQAVLDGDGRTFDEIAEERSVAA